MKVFLLCVFASAAVAAWVGLKEREPRSDARTLRAEYERLNERLQAVSEKTPASPIHEYWGRTKNTLEAFYGVRLIPTTGAKIEKNYAHKVWVGKIEGPILPVLLAVRKAQRQAPVYLERLTVRNGRAELRVHIWGA